MRITTIRSEGLAALSYFVSSENEAVVIDPRRDALVMVSVILLYLSVELKGGKPKDILWRVKK
ncbi:MAG: hypothetical protein KAR03_00855 [Candidatus Thorarchaeota archaeon]|nr:hypothetical protein [Candidatus Thorarchaeota archaeon]